MKFRTLSLIALVAGAALVAFNPAMAGSYGKKKDIVDTAVAAGDFNTLAAALGWLADHIRTTIGNLPEGDVPLREYDMPSHAVGDGQAFGGADRDKREELALWFANADLALAEIPAALKDLVGRRSMGRIVARVGD